MDASISRRGFRCTWSAGTASNFPFPPREIFAAFEQADKLARWWGPKGFTNTFQQFEFKPGGRWVFVMHGPNGEVMPLKGCFLEVVPQERLVFTDTLVAGFRPSAKPFFTAVVQMQDLPGGRTRYVALARHGDQATLKQHDEMGFHHGWGAALDQLVALAKTL